MAFVMSTLVREVNPELQLSVPLHDRLCLNIETPFQMRKIQIHSFSHEKEPDSLLAGFYRFFVASLSEEESM